MFISPGKFEKAVKEAYKHRGMAMLRTEETLAIDTGEWWAEFPIQTLPKEIHAALIKVVGWLPMVGEAYEYRQTEEAQMTMPDTVNRAMHPLEQEEEVGETPIELTIAGGGNWRLFQAESGKLMVVQEELARIPSMKDLEPKEALPHPYLSDSKIVWKSDYGALVVSAYQSEDGPARETMRALDMAGEDLTAKNWPVYGKWVRL